MESAGLQRYSIYYQKERFQDFGNINVLVKLIFQTNSPEWGKLAYNVAMLVTSAMLLAAYTARDFH